MLTLDDVKDIVDKYPDLSIISHEDIHYSGNTNSLVVVLNSKLFVDNKNIIAEYFYSGDTTNNPHKQVNNGSQHLYSICSAHYIFKNKAVLSESRSIKKNVRNKYQFEHFVISVKRN